MSTETFPPEISKALNEDARNGMSQADLLKLYSKNEEKVEKECKIGSALGYKLGVDPLEEKIEYAAGSTLCEIPVPEWVKRFPIRSEIEQKLKAVPLPPPKGVPRTPLSGAVVDRHNSPWEDVSYPAEWTVRERKLLQEVDDRIKVVTDHILSSVSIQIEKTRVEAELSFGKIVEDLKLSKSHREFLMHRVLRFREMFQVYWPERDAEYPEKTFGADVIQASRTKIMHAWYLKDPANVTADIAFYHRAAKRFEHLINDPTDTIAMETWHSDEYEYDHEWMTLALRSLQLNLDDYERMRSSIVIFERYHEDNWPLYNPDYVLKSYPCDGGEADEEELDPRPRNAPIIRNGPLDNSPPAA